MYFGHFTRCGVWRLVDAIATKIIQSSAKFCDAHKTEDSKGGSACNRINHPRLPFHGSAKIVRRR